ncbi:peptidase S58 [Lampropedia cohaerens]|uniref:Peptidase S58 n=1 Tax=Lampropedia cohaerens TaxID=1610491 RepID=A0A0U1Q190_9BURK|nr:P1 family peptidase [Lampropedia cohaerens]KKW68528.1 peptidase S58 [Lampropedia cohaerens]
MTVDFDRALAEPSCITKVAGVRVGHAEMAGRTTGCSVVLTEAGATAAVDVRGAAPGTRETDLLQPGNLVEQVHALVLCGGSAFGLAAVDGVMHWLEQRGIGLDTGFARVPIVPAAVLFDLVLGNAAIRPDAACGYAACEEAARLARAGMQVPQGSVGAGSGAVVGKLFGLAHAMRGGVGSASVCVEGITVGALVACNAVGDVRHPTRGHIIAGARVSPDALQMCDAYERLLEGTPPTGVLAGTNTTIGVIATDAALSRTQLQRLAMAGHDGLARTITPVHTMSDGDTLFALATGRVADRTLSMVVLAAMAMQAVMLATVRAVLTATAYRDNVLWLPTPHTSRPREGAVP